MTDKMTLESIEQAGNRALSSRPDAAMTVERAPVRERGGAGLFEASQATAAAFATDLHKGKPIENQKQIADVLARVLGENKKNWHWVKGLNKQESAKLVGIVAAALWRSEQNRKGTAKRLGLTWMPMGEGNVESYAADQFRIYAPLAQEEAPGLSESGSFQGIYRVVRSGNMPVGDFATAEDAKAFAIKKYGVRGNYSTMSLRAGVQAKRSVPGPAVFTSQQAYDHLTDLGFKPVGGSSRWEKGDEVGRIVDAPGDLHYVTIDDLYSGGDGKSMSKKNGTGFDWAPDRESKKRQEERGAVEEGDIYLGSGMQIGKIYIQKFNDEELYFRPESKLKNGKLSGKMVTLDVMRPRATPKSKTISVDKTQEGLWKLVQGDLNAKVSAALGSKSEAADLEALGALLGENAYDQLAKNKKYTAKAMGARVVRDLKAGLPGSKIELISSEATMPRHWDYGCLIKLDITLSNGETLKGDVVLQFKNGEDPKGEPEGMRIQVHLPFNYGGFIVSKSGDGTSWIKHGLDELIKHLTRSG